MMMTVSRASPVQLCLCVCNRAQSTPNGGVWQGDGCPTRQAGAPGDGRSRGSAWLGGPVRVDVVTLAHAVVHLHRNDLVGHGLGDRLVVDLHALDRLHEVRLIAVKEHPVAQRQPVGELNDGDTQPVVVVRDPANALNLESHFARSCSTNLFFSLYEAYGSAVKKVPPDRSRERNERSMMLRSPVRSEERRVGTQASGQVTAWRQEKQTL